MFNKFIGVGNLTRDIELRYAPNGTAIASTGLAMNRKWKGQDGQMKEEVTFVDITAFGRTAEVMNQYLRKGSKILVEGRLKLDSWVAQDGSKRSKHSISIDHMQMLDGKQQNSAPAGQQGYQQNSVPAGGQQGYQQNQGGYQQNSAPAGQQSNPAPQQGTLPEVPEIDIDDEEIPF